MNGIKRIREMRELLQAAEDLPAATRSAIEDVITKETKTWATRQKERYDEALAIRDDGYNRLMSRGHEAGRELEQLVIDVKAGRIAPKDARAKIRDYLAEYHQLTKTYNAIMTDDARLEAHAAKEPEDVQEDVFDRFPASLDGAPDLAALVSRETGADRYSPFRLSPAPEPPPAPPAPRDVIWHR